MKHVDIEGSMGLDRLATWNEVRCALSLSPQGDFELAGACNDFREMDSDFSGRACNLSEDSVWMAILSEIVDSISN